MRLLTFAAYAALDYLVVLRLAPVVQAKIEALDLDEMWDCWDWDDCDGA